MRRSWRSSGWWVLGAATLTVAVAIAGAWLWYPRTASNTPIDATATALGNFLNGETVRLLVAGDPLSIALKSTARELGRRAGGTVEVEIVAYDDMRRLTLLNAQDRRSAYDIVGFDTVWIGEYGSKRVFMPLDELIGANVSLIEPADFYPQGLRQSRYRGQQLGLPIQPHAELLIYRKDLFDAAGAAAPRTTDDVLALARRFTRPQSGQYGICWNGQRGQPLGQQMAHFYAAFGAPLLGSDGKPKLDDARGIAAAHYARALLAVSPPDVVNMAWNHGVRRFSAGGCAMAYQWAARTDSVEQDAASRIAGNVGYAAAPHAPHARPVTPLGTWSLGIPSNIGERLPIAWKFLVWLTSSEIQRYLARHGNGGIPRYSVLHDASLRERYPVFATMERLDDENQLADWMRPPVPQWYELMEILGTVYHDMLLGRLTPEQAARTAQKQAQWLFANTAVAGTDR